MAPGPAAGRSTSRVREVLARARRAVASPSSRGPASWVVTLLLGVLLPAPLAVAGVAARLRSAGAARPGALVRDLACVAPTTPPARLPGT